MTCTRAALAFGLAALLVIPWASFAQPTNAVDSLQTRYETMRQKIDAEALAAYSNVLVTVGKQLTQNADVDSFLFLQSEQRFIAEKQVLPEGPDRTNLVGKLPSLDAPLSKIEANRNAKIANLLKQYIPALGDQVRQLMIAKRIDEAKALGDVKKAAESELADLDKSRREPTGTQDPKKKPAEFSVRVMNYEPVLASQKPPDMEIKATPMFKDAGIAPRFIHDGNTETGLCLDGARGTIDIVFPQPVTHQRIIMIGRLQWKADVITEGHLVINETKQYDISGFSNRDMIQIENPGRAPIRKLSITSLQGSWNPGINEIYFLKSVTGK